MARYGRVLATLFTVVTTSVAGATVVLPGTAAAAPTNCTATPIFGVPGYGFYRCTGGTGYYRALVFCKPTPTSPWRTAARGLWEGVNHQASVAFCPSSARYLVSATGERST